MREHFLFGSIHYLYIAPYHNSSHVRLKETLNNMTKYKGLQSCVLWLYEMLKILNKLILVLTGVAFFIFFTNESLYFSHPQNDSAWA